jgi:spermidine/putrescine-binding protein
MSRQRARLRLLTWEGFAPGWLVDGLRSQAGIDLEVEYAGTNDAVISRLAPAGASGFDVTVVDHHAGVQLARMGLIEPLAVGDLPAFAGNFEAFKTTWYTHLDGQYWGLPFAWGSMALVYSPELITREEASTWKCMWDPRRRGQLAQYDSPLEAIFGAAMLSGFSNVFSMARPQLEACEALLLEQKPLLKGAYSSIEEVVEWFASGGLAVAHTWMAAVTQLQRGGIPIAWTVPREGCLAGVLQYHIVKGTLHPGKAYRFINHATRPEVCARLCCEISDSPCNPQVVDQLDAEWKARLSTDPSDIGKYVLYQTVEDYPAYLRAWKAVKAG